MTTPERYDFALAAADLEAAGMPAGVYHGRAGRWRRSSRGEGGGAFLGAVLDSRAAGPDQLFVALAGPRRHGREFVAAAVAAGAHALTDRAPEGEAPDGRTVLVTPDPLAALEVLARCWRERLEVRVVGVTGTNGKTTTKDLLAAALAPAGPVAATRGNLNSEQGVPVTLLGLRREHRLAVVEMGASDVGHIAARANLARPEVGVITNAAAAHLEEFGSLDRVIDGKGELVEALPASGVAILNADSPGFDRWRARTRARVVTWGREAGDHRWSWTAGDADRPGWLTLDGERWPVPLPGRHNAANLVAAILAARAVGASDAVVAEGLRGFRPSPHRSHVRRLGGRLVLDDAYNANPESTLAAARMLCDLAGGDAVAVLGSMAELGVDSADLHRRCGRALADLPLDHVVAVGDLAAPLADGYAEGGGRAVRCDDPARAASHLAATVPAGDRILVKGSRSSAMERVVERLVHDHGWAEETP